MPVATAASRVSFDPLVDDRGLLDDATILPNVMAADRGLERCSGLPLQSASQALSGIGMVTRKRDHEDSSGQMRPQGAGDTR